MIGFFSTQLEKSDIPVRALTTAAYRSRARSAQEVDDLEENLKEYETRISQMNSSYESLQRRYLQLTELRHVLRESSGFFEQASNPLFISTKKVSKEFFFCRPSQDKKHYVVPLMNKMTLHLF